VDREIKHQKDSKLPKESKLPTESVDKFCQNQLQTWKKLAEVQLDFSRLWVDYCNACCQRMSGAKDIADLYAIEAGLSTEFGSRFAECSRKALETISVSQQELMGCFTSPESIFRSMFMDYPALWKNFPGGKKDLK